MELHRNLITITILAFTFIFLQPTQISSTTVPKAYQTFIKTSCNITTYPSVCYKTLSPNATTIKTDYIKLCSVSLSNTITVANKTLALISYLADRKGLTHEEVGAFRDCIENIEDTVDELQQTIEAVNNLEGEDRAFQLSNAKTYASAAITDEDTCVDSLSVPNVSLGARSKVKKSISNLTELNSNSLALINRIY